MLTVRKAVTQALIDLGVSMITGANSGQQALDMLTKAANTDLPFHFVISDWHMPDLSGLELARKCRHNSKLANIGFLMLTSETDTKKVVEAMLAGADNYVLKPVVPTDLKNEIMSVVKKRYPAVTN